MENYEKKVRYLEDNSEEIKESDVTFSRESVFTVADIDEFLNIKFKLNIYYLPSKRVFYKRAEGKWFEYEIEKRDRRELQLDTSKNETILEVKERVDQLHTWCEKIHDFLDINLTPIRKDIEEIKEHIEKLHLRLEKIGGKK